MTSTDNAGLNPNSIFTVLAAARFGAYAMSLDQTILFWNQSAQRILGYSPVQVVGRRCFEIPPSIAQGGLNSECRHGCLSMRYLRDGRIPPAIRLRLLCASGQRKLVNLKPMVVAGLLTDAPLIVHLFDEATDVEDFDHALDSVREEISLSGAQVVSDHAPPQAVDPADAVRLSPRQLEVLRLVALGRRSPQIAAQLGISIHTVDNHIRHLRRKLGAASKLEAVVAAVRRGILAWS